MSERDELVARLRNLYRESWPAVYDAADQIVRDGREIGRLRKVVSDIANQKNAAERFTGADYDFEYGFDMCIALARAALNKEDRP